MQLMRNIGELVDMRIGIPPTTDTGSTINGAGINRQPPGKSDGFQSCKLHYALGAEVGGAVTSADCKLQDSPDNSVWTDIPGAAVTQLTAELTAATVDVDLSNAEEFVRAVSVTVTAGTNIPVAATITFGGAQRAPAAL